ncbi:hypothetical protein Misp05_01720 [Micromonospora sp. NBRC 107095]|nr:hypothetical protein Misp05_01720 [Micromonospora sp. NBRC 107095]
MTHRHQQLRTYGRSVERVDDREQVADGAGSVTGEGLLLIVGLTAGIASDRIGSPGRALPL